MSRPSEDEKQEFRRQAEAAFPPPGPEFQIGANFVAQFNGEWDEDRKRREKLIQKEYERLLYDAYPNEALRDGGKSCLSAIGGLVLLVGVVWLLGVISRAL